MARKGWVLIWHKLGDHPLWLEEPFTRGQAWLDLILMASTPDKENAGAVCCSRRYLASRWKWSQHKVDRFLKRLEKDGMVFVTQNGTRNGSQNGTLLTLAKYRMYQTGGKRNGTRNDKQDGTQNGDIERIGKEAARHAEAGGAEKGEVPAPFRSLFDTVEAYEEWRRENR